MAFVEFSDVRKTYRMGEVEVHAVDGMSFSIEEGELCVIVGPSGAGKTTVLNMLGGMDSCTSGTISLDGREVSSFSPRELTLYRRYDVGFVFQFYNLVPSLTARENVELVTEIARQPMPADRALALVGLSDRADHFPAQLSGGEQQRVAIARAIAKNPEVLLCDEPTGALDSATGIKVLEALTLVNRAVGATTLVITHNAAIRDIADRVIRFADGRIVEETTNAVKKTPAEVAW